MIKHDTQGFLVGEVMDMTRRLIDGQREGLDALGRIEQAISRMAWPPRARARVAAPDGVAAHPTLRRSSSVAPAAVGRVAGQAAAEVALRAARARDLSGASIAEPVLQRSSSRALAAQVATRDARGRFVSGQSRPSAVPVSPGAGGAGDGDSPDKVGRMGEALSKILGNIKDATANATHNIDPTLQAATEIRNVVEPLGRGLSVAVGRRKEQRQERWWRRIYRALTSRDADKKKSQSVVVQGGGGSGGGLLDGAAGGAVVGLVMRILPALGALILPILGIAAAALAGLGIGKLISDWLTSSGVSQKLYDAVDFMKKSWSDMMSWLKGVVETVVNAPKKIADAAENLADKVVNGAGEIANKANDFVKNKTGIDVKDAAGKVAAGASHGIALTKDLAAQAAGALPKPLLRGGALLKEAMASGILDPRKLSNFMGQMHHESAGFSRLEENLNYSPERLMTVFKGRFKSIEDARAVAAGGPKAIAQRVYGGRMGNDKDGDGYKYRGRGHIQLTGKENYAAASKDLGIDLLNNPDLAADPSVAAKVAVWYWNKRVAGRGMDKTVKDSRRAINGGLNGLKDAEAKASEWHSALAGQGATSVVASAAAASAKMPHAAPVKIPVVTPPVAVEAPIKINRDPERAITIRVPQDVGQNVGDRSIAHVVTGGLGGS